MTFGNKAAEEFGISTPEGGVRKIGKNERQGCNKKRLALLNLPQGGEGKQEEYKEGSQTGR